VPRKYNFKRLRLCIILLIVVLVITNPGIKNFKDYLGYTSYSGLRRTQNWFVLSVYQDGSEKYIGVILNFLKIPERTKNEVEFIPSSESTVDTLPAIPEPPSENSNSLQSNENPFEEYFKNKKSNLVDINPSIKKLPSQENKISKSNKSVWDDVIKEAKSNN